MLYLSGLSNRAVNEPSRSFPVSNLITDQDLFRQLGPEAVFSAKHDWSPPRTVHLTRRQHGDTGDSNTQVQGDCRQGERRSFTARAGQRDFAKLPGEGL